ncbi:hypothetical protein [Sphingomonas sp. ABOLF]|nr:hypothetical protein [Sphingomonas sp. ABOLF]
MSAPDLGGPQGQPRSQAVVRALAASAGLMLLILAILCNAAWEMFHG